MRITKDDFILVTMFIIKLVDMEWAL